MSEELETQDIEVSSRKRIPSIWYLPIIAALIGLWMLYYNISNQGPVVTIQFNTAEGIEAGKTKIKARNVNLGVVESVTLGEGLENVVVTAQLDPAARPFVNEATQFWVVRARVGAGGISGLGTILSGGYIELAPGESAERRREFIGLETPPITSAGTPGMHVFLESRRAGSVGTGDPILYRGFKVGQIESEEFDIESESMRYRAFIRAPYDSLLRSTSHFWNKSGIDVSATSQGFSLRTGSLQTILTGGVEFETDEGDGRGEPVTNGMGFTLYASEQEAEEDPYRASVAYVVMFEQSLRGLNPGAPVELRGLQVGRVERIMLEELRGTNLLSEGHVVPVLIRVEPGRMSLPDDETGIQLLRETVPNSVARNLFATLQTGSLITGQLIVDLDFFPQEPAGEMGTFAGYPTVPTLSTGLAQIEEKVMAILDRVETMPLAEIGVSTKKTLDELSATLQTMRGTLVSIETVLGAKDTERIPKELADTLQQLRTTLSSFAAGSSLYERLDGTVLELQRTLKNVEDLVQSIEDQPSSLIFPVSREPDPEPGGR